MKVYSFSKQESVVNNNGNIKKYKRVVQHDGKKGIEQVEKDGKVKTRKFKVRNNKRNNKGKSILPGILAFKRRNNKSNNAKGVTKRRKKTKRIKGNKKNKTKKNKKSKKVKKNDKGFWEKLFF